MNEFVDLITRQAERYGDREALRYRDYVTQAWTSMSWNRFKRDIEREARALYKTGVEPQGKIAIFTQNCPEILVSHFAAFYNRAVPVPIYATSSKSEAKYIIDDSGSRVLFAGDQRQYELGLQLLDECESLAYLVTLDPRVERLPHDKVSLTRTKSTSVVPQESRPT